MDYLLEVLKIVEGGMRGDSEKVKAYASQLAERLEAAGDSRAGSSIRRALGGPGGLRQLGLNRATPPPSRLPVDTESRLSLADETHPPPGTRVFLRSDVEATVERFLAYIGAADRLIAHGVGIKPSLLIYGPPGCGKTELAKYVALRLSLPLVTARTDGLLSSYLGSTAKNIRVLFEHAMSRPCVLFLDEFDAVAKLRDDKHELGELKRVVVSLLQNIDALDGQTILLAATNHPQLLDHAIWRRFGSHVKVDLPDRDVRIALFRHFLGDLAAGLNLGKLAAASRDLNGSHIRQACDDTKRAAIIAGRSRIEMHALIGELARIHIHNFHLGSAPPYDQLKALRTVAPQVFSYRALAPVFGVSKSQVAKLVSEEKRHAANPATD